MNKKIQVAILVCVAILIGFVAGQEYQKRITPLPEPNLTGEDFSIVWQTWAEIENKFIGEIDHKKMIYGAAKGMVAALGDPYTMVLEPEQANMLQEDMSGEFEGVGMYLDYRDHNIVVVSPIKGTPADQAGLEPLDIIIKVNGTSTAKMTLDDVVDLIRGPKGTSVNLTVLRGESDIFDVDVQRKKIDIPSVELEVKEDGVAHIKILQFSAKTTYQFEQALQEAVLEDCDKFIVDLRNNPGGLLDQAVAVSQYFLNQGDYIVFEGNSKVMEETPYIANVDGPLVGYPLVVLINGGSASGAEILAAAWQDNGVAQLIGTKTFGKGSVQLPVDLREDALLKVTIAQWMTPNKKVIDKEGIEPDIEVEITEEDYKAEKDPQLEKAIEIVTTK